MRHIRGLRDAPCPPWSWWSHAGHSRDELKLFIPKKLFFICCLMFYLLHLFGIINSEVLWGISLHRILSFQYSSTFVQWLIKELLNIILAWQYHLVAGLGTEVLTQGRLPLPVPALGLAVPRGRHRPDKRSKLISTTINVNRINQSFKCAIKIIWVDTWNLNVSSFSFTSSTCWYDKEDQHRIYLRPPHTLVFVILCLYLRIPGGDESGQGQGEADPRCCHPPGHYVSVWISGLRPTPGKTPNNSQFEDDFPNQSWQRCYHPVCPPVPEIVQWHNRWEYGIFRKMDDGSSNVAQPSPGCIPALWWIMCEHWPHASKYWAQVRAQDKWYSDKWTPGQVLVLGKNVSLPNHPIFPWLTRGQTGESWSHELRLRHAPSKLHPL